MSWPVPFSQNIHHKYYGDFIISFHALKRFYKRYLKQHPELSLDKKDSVEFFYNKFSKHFASSIQTKRKNEISQLLAHNMEKAFYLRSGRGHGNWIFVVTPNKHIITCFRLEMRNKSLYKNIYPKKNKQNMLTSTAI